MAVIKVKTWGEDQGDFVLIEESDFNEDMHELFDSPIKRSRKPKAQENDTDATS